MIEVKKNTIIYVACPANAATGGPELLHQLVFKMNQFGYNAMMFYYPNNVEDPVHPRYKKYGNEFVREIRDEEKNILIVPEVKTDLIYKYKKLRKAIWWLSVNYFPRYPRSFKHRIKIILKTIKNQKWCYNFEHIDKLYHLVQSYYAKNYLLTKGVNSNKIYYLSGYIDSIFISKQLENNNYIKKEDIVVYNPRKGYEFTKKIIEKAPDIKFEPIGAINDMSQEEVAELLLKSKIYIDFGDHPGKDRIPREAAISNCVVIVGKKGSAVFEEDVPIDEKYKFEVKKAYIPQIINKIRYSFDNYEIIINDFDEYKQSILEEEKNFEKNIKKIFILL